MIRLLTIIVFAALATAAGPGAAEPVSKEDGGRTYLRVLPQAPDSVSRRLTVPLHKSIVLERSHDVRDVLVADPSIVEAVIRTPRRIFLLGRAPGETTVFLFGRPGQQADHLDIEVTPDPASLEETLNRLLPESRIKVETLGQQIILTGRVGNERDAEFARTMARRFAGQERAVLDRLEAGDNRQVLLRVRMLEVQRGAMRRLGIDPTGLLAAGDAAIDTILALPRAISGAPGEGSRGSLSLWPRGDDQIALLIRALERDGLARVLAEPSLTARVGREARFFAGGEIPVPVPGRGYGTGGVDYKPFGVRLSFTPTIRSARGILLDIATQVSDVLPGPGEGPPALSMREATTSLEIPSGRSLVMAGLIRETTRTSLRGVPGLKHLPVLGTLFRSRSFETAESELIIIVTPFLAAPVAPETLATPGDGLQPAEDLEGFIFGRLTSLYGGDPRRMGAQSRQGGYGYIVK